MLLDVFKILVDEPSRVKKAGLLCCKFLSNAILTNFFYIKLYGTYQIINITNHSEWLDGILSGELLVGILLFGFSNFLLFTFMSSFTSIPLDFIANFIYKRVQLYYFNKPKVIFTFLNWFEWIKYDSTTLKMEAGRETGYFFDLISALTNEETKNELSTMKRSFVNGLWHTYLVVFVLLYSFADLHPQPGLLRFFIICGILLIIFYVAVNAILRLIHDYGSKLQFDLHEKLLLRAMQNAIQSTLSARICDNTSNLNGFDKVVCCEEVEYGISFQYKKNHITSVDIESLKELHNNSNKKILVVTNRALTNKAEQLLGEFEKLIFIIQFTNEKDLTDKVCEFFNSKASI